MPKLTKKTIRHGRTDGRKDGPTLIIKSFAFKNLNVHFYVYTLHFCQLMLCKPPNQTLAWSVLYSTYVCLQVKNSIFLYYIV